MVIKYTTDNMESLKDQAQEIDNPNVPKEEGKVFIDLMQCLIVITW